ncbi:hypothetical protein VOLCADRAFT_107230 [Volvox carteri f. nagariensis]|uniref:Uncharacterized protein n=1 Tax=Volvox carteri f. nagariensis TaxID=3068 RepID=D8UCR3_VOLCA|nr:uncharacterized protein VOLCADRAFT_107230 [Volvox carteri f. nagariensis]EFJ42538.1 hypothetical protein VOLCADRAFT_107230 [Volvox carteri f. nagariensis]|eukprot:XP_002956394.1 hypothetical protein VOLCADRAFT_107230 [Volvox carteri f. nagariensis]
MVEDIQKKVLIPKQKEAFLCCAKCCDTSSGPRDLEACRLLHRDAPQPCCRHPLLLPPERFQRAAMRCQDEVKDMLGFEPSHSDQARAQLNLARTAFRKAAADDADDADDDDADDGASVSLSFMSASLQVWDLLPPSKFDGCMEAAGKEFLQKVPKLKGDLLAALQRR